MPKNSQTALSDEAIRLRSYYIWEREGRPEGCDADHWLRALSELQAELEAQMLAAAATGESTAFVMPRLPISSPPRKAVSIRIGEDKAA